MPLNAPGTAADPATRLLRDRKGGLPKEARLAIVGGGCTGLSAARCLSDAGYTDVTVLEVEARLGGKSCTLEVDGRRYDLGAVVGLVPIWNNIFEMAHSHGLDDYELPPLAEYDLETGRKFQDMSLRGRLAMGGTKPL